MSHAAMLCDALPVALLDKGRDAGGRTSNPLGCRGKGVNNQQVWCSTSLGGERKRSMAMASLQKGGQRRPSRSPN